MGRCRCMVEVIGVPRVLPHSYPLPAGEGVATAVFRRIGHVQIGHGADGVGGMGLVRAEGVRGAAGGSEAYSFFTAAFTSRCRSRSCRAETAAGESVIR